MRSAWLAPLMVAASTRKQSGALQRQRDLRSSREAVRRDEGLALNAAGMACEDSPLVEQSGTKCALLAKNVGPLGCERILSELAAERGRSLENIPVAFRNRRVADACPYSCGLCETCAPGCVKWFIGNGWCEPACNVPGCQFDGGDCWERDCVVGGWSDWSECSKKCGPGGYQSRTRSTLIAPTSGGQQCPELEEKKYGCNAEITCPTECEVSPWSEWGACDHECGIGERSRTRQVLVKPKDGGGECPVLIQTQPCFERECDTDCEVSAWTDWSECSSHCGTGTQLRTRHVLASSSNGCDLPLIEERTCTGTLCDVEHCVPTVWSDWSDCNAPCGGGVAQRERVLLLGQDRPECEDYSLTEQMDCNVHPCPADCELTDWSEWSSCTSSCGEGLQTRTRKVTVHPTKSGRACGPLVESRQCFNQPCPQDCSVSAWSSWSKCSLPTGVKCGKGSKVRERHVIQFAANGGQACPTRLSEFAECIVECEDEDSLLTKLQPEKCTYSDDWSEWSGCIDACHTDSVDFNQQRHKLIDVWTPFCEDVIQEKPCSCDEVERNEDCVVTEWSNWTECTAPCGGTGTRTRYRSLISVANNASCALPLVQTEPCGLSACPTQCPVSSWSDWTECSAECGVGTSVRHRKLMEQIVDSSVCGDLNQVAACASTACAQDCEVSDWSRWSECSATCGGGTQMRTRTVVKPTVGDGVLCPHLSESRDCNLQPCNSDCILSDWSEWTTCTGSCSLSTVGYETRTRSVVSPKAGRGQPCSLKTVESRECKLDCPPAETVQQQAKAGCAWSEWSDWSECLGSCDEGVTTRRRTLETGIAHACGGDEQVQAAPCALPACKVDCQVSAWSPWSECSATCGGGERWRSRSLLQSPFGKGAMECPPFWESEVCNDQPCRGDECILSEWSSWTDCTAECGGGVKERSRSILVPPGPNGEPCESTHEIKGCNLQRCTGEACRDNPQIEANGIGCNILKTQGCRTNLFELASKHGVTMPEGIPPEARVQDACPETCGMCEECAPGCELRDLGNTVCTDECNNEACQFDLGDCGADCQLSDDLAITNMISQSSATALRVGDGVSLTCPAAKRVQHHTLFSQVDAICADDKSLMVPQLGNIALKDVKCIDDSCPIIHVDVHDSTGSSLAMFGGSYRRADDVGYVKQFGLIHAHYVFLMEEGSLDAGRWIFFLSKEAKAKDGLPKALQTYHLAAAENESLAENSDGSAMFVSSICRVTGQNLPNVNCHGSTLYLVSDLKHSAETVFWEGDDGSLQYRSTELELASQMDVGLELSCLSELPDAYAHPNLTTALQTGPNASLPLPCEDVKIVEQVSGFSCSQMVNSLGCGFRLSDSGQTLPPILPEDATVGFICPASCGLCEVNCAESCPDWFIGNRHCDSSCNTASCGFDAGDCVGPSDTELAAEHERALGSKASNSTSVFEAVRGVDADNCEDDSLVAEMGFSCKLLYMASSISGDCSVTISDLAKSQGLSVQLPVGVPADTRVLDACPKTCNACDEKRYLRPTTSALAIQPVDYDTAGCSDSDELVYSYASLTCSELVHLLPDCSLSVAALGYLPEGMPDDLTLTTLCPLACKACTNPKAPKYKCHDFDILQSMTGFSCGQAVGLLGVSSCQKALNSFGYELPAALPSTLVLADLCGVSCNSCPANDMSYDTDVQDSFNNIADCRDEAYVYDLTGHECNDFVELTGVRCGYTFSSLGYGSENERANTTVGDACPLSCGTCRIKSTGVCADSAIVAQEFKTDCFTLINNGGCAMSLESLLPAAVFGSNASYKSYTVSQVCRESCDTCGVKEEGCADHPAVTASGFSCPMLLQFGSCETPLSNLMGRSTITVPSGATIQDACPLTCGMCVAASVDENVNLVCEDSSLLQAVNFACDQVLSLAGGGGKACLANLADIAAGTPFAAMLPAGLTVADLCKRTCHQCDVATCDDGYQNGQEEFIDCGGPGCPPCKACRSSDLKHILTDHLSIDPSSEDGSFTNGSQRKLMCDSGWNWPTKKGQPVITCQDGVWTDPAAACDEDTLEVWRFMIGLTHGENLMHDFVLNLAESLEVLFSLITDAVAASDIKILSAGSCSAMSTGSSDDCVDNTLVEATGFTCSMLAGFGCNNVIADLAASAGVATPAGLPVEATVADACPLTCDTCEESAARMAEFMAASGGNGVLGTDCFKADVAVNSNLDLLNTIKSTLGSKENVERVLLAAVKDSVIAHNTTLRTTWSPATGTNDAQSRLVTVIDYINGRPVSLLLTEVSEGGSFSLDSDDSASDALELDDLIIRSNVTLSAWAKAAGTDAGLEAARDVFQSSGLKPSLQFMDVGTIVESFVPSISQTRFLTLLGTEDDDTSSASPFFFAGGLTKSSTKAYALNTTIFRQDFDGIYSNSGNAGAVLDGSIIANVMDCAATDPELTASCCSLKTDFISFLTTSECGPWLFGETVSEHELQSLCTAPSSLNQLETGSCYRRMKRLINKYRENYFDPSCDVISLIDDLLDSWCTKDPIKKTYCMTSFADNLGDMTLDNLATKFSEELELVCAANSCTRNHVKYLHAIVNLNVAWGLQSHVSGSNNVATNIGRRLLGEVVAPEAAPLRRLAASGYDNWSTRILPIAEATEDMLDLVCYKSYGGYCQHTLQLLMTSDPITNPSVTTSCTSPCFMPLMAKLGGIVERQGRAMNSPKHAILGSALNHYAKHACMKTPNNDYCHSTYHPPTNWSPELLSIDRGTPPYDANNCDCSTFYLGDGTCDQRCFKPACAYDGGDCFTESMYTTFTSSLLGATCVDSINDACLPTSASFTCAACKQKIDECIEKNGCCYAGALETLKNMLAAEKDLQAKTARRNPLKISAADLQSPFRLDWSISSLEEECGIALDRNCLYGTKSTEYVLQYQFGPFQFSNASRRMLAPRAFRSELLSAILPSTNFASDSKIGKRPAFTSFSNAIRQLSESTESAIGAVNVWLRSRDSRAELARLFNVVPDDIVRVWLQPLADDSAAMIIHFDPGNSVPGVLAIRKGDEYQTEVLDWLTKAPEFSQLRSTGSAVTPIGAFGLSENTKSGAKPGSKSTTKLPVGAWSATNTTNAVLESCSLTALHKQLGATETPSGTSQSTFQHGDQVSTVCSSGYVAPSRFGTSGVWQCVSGLWVATSQFFCDLPCPANVLESLELSSASVAIQPVSDNPDVALVASTMKPVRLLPGGAEYEPGDSVMIACHSDLSVDISSGLLGVVTSTCKNGQWSKVALDCQPACSAIPGFVNTDREAYQLSGSDTKFGAYRNVSCATYYFANPPTFEGKYELVQCAQDGVWKEPSFRCVLGITVDPSHNPSTVQKMLTTLFSKTGVVSLAVFSAVAVVVVVIITLFWLFYYKRRADRAYLERKKLLQEYVTATTGGGALAPSAERNPAFPIGGWEGRSPSSSTVSAFRRISMLRNE